MVFGKRKTATHRPTPKKKKGFDRTRFIKNKSHRGWFMKLMTKKL